VGGNTRDRSTPFSRIASPRSSGSISTPVRPTVRASATSSTRPRSASMLALTSAQLSGRGCARGISIPACLALHTAGKGERVGVRVVAVGLEVGDRALHGAVDTEPLVVALDGERCAVEVVVGEVGTEVGTVPEDRAVLHQAVVKEHLLTGRRAGRLGQPLETIRSRPCSTGAPSLLAECSGLTGQIYWTSLCIVIRTPLSACAMGRARLEEQRRW
jgi:hypothetical protein